MIRESDVRTRVLELDGVRGLAILLVVTTHVLAGAYPSYREGGAVWLPAGGLHGVQLFFVLSGYLITRILLDERARTGSIDLRRFWTRRIRRLYPPLVALLAAYAAFIVLTWDSHAHRGSGVGAIVSAATYTSNFLPTLGVPDSRWLGHTWSLAVEEQFYLAWPILLLAGAKLRGIAGVRVVALLGIVATIGLRELSPGVAYTLLRWDALLLGCLLATMAAPSLRVARALGSVGLVAMLMLSGLDLERTNLLYVVSALAGGALVVGATALPVLRVAPLVHFGLISYSLYLFHVVVLRFGWPLPQSIVLSWALAEVSFRLVERRFLSATRLASGRQPRISPRSTTTRIASNTRMPPDSAVIGHFSR